MIAAKESCPPSWGGGGLWAGGTLLSLFAFMHLRNNAPSLSALIHFARHMRKRPTRSEALLWAQLRGRKVGGRFRRQAVLGRFIVDFYSPCDRLVVEVDGGMHLEVEQRHRDAARQAELEELYGVRFVRVSAELVERDVRAAVACIRAALGR